MTMTDTSCATTHFNAKGEPIPCPGSHATTAAERIAELKTRAEKAEQERNEALMSVARVRAVARVAMREAESGIHGPEMSAWHEAAAKAIIAAVIPGPETDLDSRLAAAVSTLTNVRTELAELRAYERAHPAERGIGYACRRIERVMGE